MVISMFTRLKLDAAETGNAMTDTVELLCPETEVATAVHNSLVVHIHAKDISGSYLLLMIITRTRQHLGSLIGNPDNQLHRCR